MIERVAVDAAEVRRIAELASLELDPKTIETLRRELQSILDHVAILAEVDVSAVPPSRAHRSAATRLRDDVVQPSLATEQALANAPDSGSGHFRVPRVLEG